MKLNVQAFGLAAGIFWGVGVFLFAFLAPVWGATEVIDWLAKFYLGYGSDFTGALIGGLWGFADAGIGCAIFAWLYNKLAQK